MLFCVVDDVQFDPLPKHDVFPAEEAYGFAAYVLPLEGLRAVLDTLATAKKNAGLQSTDPIKSHVDRQIERIYRQRYPKDADARILAANECSVGGRESVLRSLPANGAVVFASLNWPFSEAPKRPEVFEWSFENLLQRFGLYLKDRVRSNPGTPTLVLADRHEGDGLNQIFTDGVARGEGYFSGPLGALGVIETLASGHTPFSNPLQVADFVAGGFRDFVRWAMKGDRQAEAKRHFRPLIPAIHRNGERIESIGITIKPYAPFSVEQKIAELAAMP